MKRTLLNMYMFILFASFLSCAGTKPSAEKEVEKPLIVEEKEVSLSFEEQKNGSLELFNKILELSKDDVRQANLDVIVGFYIRIINNYPDAPLAQESYMRLIGVYLRDYSPPREDEVMVLYRYFKSRYPESPLKNAIEDSISRHYYRKKKWDELENFVTPYIKEFIKTGELKKPNHLFYFSEAKFNKNNYKEAYKGYSIIIKKFPRSRDAKTSIQRLEVIRKAIAERNRKAE
ncbi:MAG: hypothetical protein V3V59_04505 [Thermodesulfovibrionales bacterium]